MNLLAHMKEIGKSMMKIKDEDDSSVDVRYKPSGDLIIGVKSPYWNVDFREFYRCDSCRLRRGIKLKWNKLRFECATRGEYRTSCEGYDPFWGPRGPPEPIGYDGLLRVFTRLHDVC